MKQGFVVGRKEIPFPFPDKEKDFSEFFKVNIFSYLKENNL